MADPTTTIRIGPADHGRHMSFDDFRDAEASPGYRYELARRVIRVVDVPGGAHAGVSDAIHQQLALYRSVHPGVIHLIAPGSECRLEAPVLQSERHPDRALYLTPRPAIEPPWAVWVPEIVIEIVSKGGEKRDYEDKREDYLAAGVTEYWIVDPQKRTMLALTRRENRWTETTIDAHGVYSTQLLPAFELRMQDVFSTLDES